jgi:hypothetical protein
VSDRLLLHRLLFKFGDLTCKDTATGPFIPDPRSVAGRGMKGKLLTMAAISSLLRVRVRQGSLNNWNPGPLSTLNRTETRFWSSGPGQECSDRKKSDRTEGQPVGEKNSPRG